MAEFVLVPILGRRTDVPENHPSLFKSVGDNIVMTHDVGGKNFDLARKRQACSKSYGYLKYNQTANAQATRCQGLFEWWDGSRFNHVMVDNGRIYWINPATLACDALADSAGTVFTNKDTDLFSFGRVGTYMIFSDGYNIPYKWQYGDSYLTALIPSGNDGDEYVFKNLVVFQRRVIGLYSGGTNGDIDVRWTDSWPTTAITNLSFPAANQLWIPNDDSIVTGGVMGIDRCYIYSKDSIHQLVYYPDFDSPFALKTLVPTQGCAAPRSLVSTGNSHYFFNREFGFVRYDGGTEFPVGGAAISAPIDGDIRAMNPAFYDRIVGAYIPVFNKIAWLVNTAGYGSPSYIYYLDLTTGDWTVEDRAMRFIDAWTIVPTYTWNNLITALGGTGAKWSAVPAGTTWAYYTSSVQATVYANTNGYVYYHTGNTLDSAAIDGYRYEPVLDFGNAKMKKLVKGIWFDLGVVGNYSIDVSHRMGQTLGELLAASWTSLGTVSCNSPVTPALRNFGKSARLHQFKWGTDAASEPFQVARITIDFEMQSEN